MCEQHGTSADGLDSIARVHNTPAVAGTKHSTAEWPPRHLQVDLRRLTLLAQQAQRLGEVAACGLEWRAGAGSSRSDHDNQPCVLAGNIVVRLLYHRGSKLHPWLTLAGPLRRRLLQLLLQHVALLRQRLGPALSLGRLLLQLVARHLAREQNGRRCRQADWVWELLAGRIVG